MSELVLGDRIGEVKDKLVTFIYDNCHAANLPCAVIGLSGGVDSAVVAYLCVEALGKENVYGVCMPHDTSSPESLEHGQLVIDRLGIFSETVDLTPMARPHFAYPHSCYDDVLRRGNILARLRMIILYDLSEYFSSLVIGTSNKSEWLLGYFTLHGDGAAAFHPLLDLYKTQVFELARYLGVPDEIVDKAPSADLWPGQTDEGELGYSYAEIDKAIVEILTKVDHISTLEAGPIVFPHIDAERLSSIYTEYQAELAASGISVFRDIMTLESLDSANVEFIPSNLGLSALLLREGEMLMPIQEDIFTRMKATDFKRQPLLICKVQ